MNKHRTIEAMRQHGGSFDRAIADAWLAADPENRAKIEVTWWEMFERYAAMAR